MLRIGWLLLSLLLSLLTGVLLLGAQRGLSQISVQTWRGLNLPASTGLFLQALCLGAVLYALWILLGLGFHTLAAWAEHRGRFSVAARLRRYSPRLLRGLVISAVHTGLVISAPTMGAVAAPVQDVAEHEKSAPTTGLVARDSLTEVPVPTWIPQQTAVNLHRALGSPAPDQAPRTSYREVIVQPGDCLWGIAQQRLGETASIAEIAGYWPRIHTLNRQVIGADPNFLQVGTVLLLPALR